MTRLLFAVVLLVPVWTLTASSVCPQSTDSPRGRVMRPESLFELGVAYDLRKDLRNAVAHAVFDSQAFATASVRSMPGSEAALRRVLEALAERPRVEAWPLVAQVLSDDRRMSLHPLARAASDPAGLRREDVWSMFDAMTAAEERGDRPGARALRRALERIPRDLADRVVGEVLRRLAGGGEFAQLQILCERTSARGRARLAFGVDLARGEAETELVRWLGAEDPALLSDWAEREFLAGRDDRLSIGHLPTAVVREHQSRLVALVADDSRDVGLRSTALDALIGAGVTTAEVAEVACDDRLLNPRTSSRLSSVDWESAEPFLAHLEVGGERTLLSVLVRCPGGLEALERIATESDRSDAAAILVREGSGPRALRVWDAADFDRRAYLAPILARRSDRLGRERLDDLRALGPKGLVARLRLSDQSVIDEWLALDERWSLRRIRSFSQLAAPLLEPRHVDGFVEVLLDETLPDRDRIVVCELARRRPELGFTEALKAVAASQPDEFLLEEVEAALFADASERRAALDRALETPVGDLSIALLDQIVSAADGRSSAGIGSDEDVSLEQSSARLQARVLLEAGHETLAFRVVGRQLDRPSEALVTALIEELAARESRPQPSSDLRPNPLVLLACLDQPGLRSGLGPRYVRRIDLSETDPVSRFLALWLLAESAERDGRFERAARNYEEALGVLEGIDRWDDRRFDLCRAEPAGPGRRSAVAFRASRPSICRSRALAVERPDSARRELRTARSLAFGDAAAEAEVAALETSIR